MAKSRSLRVAALVAGILGGIWLLTAEASDIGKPAYSRIQEGGADLPQRTILNFASGVTCMDNAPATDCEAAAGSTVLVDTAANILASSPADGTLGIPNDSVYPILARVSGAWQFFSMGRRMLPLSLAGMTARNAGSVTTSTTTGTTSITNPGLNTTAMSAWVQASPGATFTVTVHVQLNNTNTAFGGCLGPVLSDGTKYIGVLHWMNDQFYLDYWNTTTSFNGDAISYGDHLNRLRNGGGFWVRIVEDSTNRLIQFSADGFSWITSTSQAKTTFLTTTEVGVGIDQRGTQNTVCTFDYFSAL